MSLPAPCVMNEITSPVTKIFVIQFSLMTTWFFPPMRLINRPKSMYIDAANRAGPSKITTVCAMYVRLMMSSPVASAEIVRAT